MLIEEIIFQSSILSIGVFAFNDCKKLGLITIPLIVEKIERYAFSECSSSKCN